jgi:peptidoglycan/LPS O-acetylase OafA/YrhL
MAPVRLCFPFVTGLWLHQVHHVLPRWRAGYLALSVVLVALFAAPTLPVASGVAWNGVYEAACVVAAFPLVVLTGANSGGGPRSLALCKACGRLSYPLYITHFPLLYVWGNYVTGRHPPLSTTIPVAAAILPLLILFAWAAHRGWDLPIRRWLSGRQDIAN